MKIAKIELENGISFAIKDDQLPLTIGRAKNCDIRFSEPYISRQHCELFMGEGHALCLKDTSANGTTVDDRLVTGESIHIMKRSQVMLAEECAMTVTPTDNDGITLVPDFNSIDLRQKKGR